MSTSLELARAGILNECETLTLHGVKFVVPPVPNAVMKQFCSTIRLWDTITEELRVATGTEDEPGEGLSTVEFLEKVLPVVDSLVDVFYLTVTTLDEGITRESIELLVNHNNFVEVYYCLSRTSGLSPKKPKEDLEVAAPKEKKPIRNGRTGTK